MDLHTSEYGSRRIVCRRISILFAISGTLVPLLAYLDFDSNNKVQSCALTVVYSSIFCIELGNLLFKKKLSRCELNVYCVMLISSTIISAIYLEDRYRTGKDSKQEFCINMLGIFFTTVAEVYQVVLDQIEGNF